MLIDKYLPDFDVREHHEARVEAPADAIYAALRSLDLNRSWTVRTLCALRSLPSRLRPGRPAAPPPGPFFDQALALGWAVLAEVPGRELVAGAVTQPWAPVVRFQGLPAAEVAGFSTPGFTKIVWSSAAAAPRAGSHATCARRRGCSPPTRRRGGSSGVTGWSSASS